MRRRITEVEFEGMKRMFNEGKSYKEIAEAYDRTRKTIANKFLETGANKMFDGLEKKCKGCGNSFLIKDRYNTNKRIFCTDQCKSLYNGKNKGLYEFTCKGCGKCDKSYDKRKMFCDKECRRKYTEMRRNEEMIERNRKRTIKMYKYICGECNRSGLSKYKRKYCSRQCSDKAKEERRRMKMIMEKSRPKKCMECGKWFSTHIDRKSRCSIKCNKRYENRKNDLYKRKRGKLIKMNGKVNEDISIERLIKRDKGKCYLCNDKVKLSRDYNDDMYPVIEHVTPIVRGGTHTWDNVRLAHRICNNLKGTKTEEEYFKTLEVPGRK